MPIRSKGFSIYGLWFAACLIAPIGTSAQAQRVTIAINGPFTASADYVAGQRDKPAALILHGFLQTHEFPTVRQLTQHLAGAGYTVLAPTLTLGIANRKQSLACEAINTHTLQDAAREIDLWVRWLKNRRAPIILIGHSFGTIYLLNYLERNPEPAISKLIGISLVEGGLSMTDNGQRQALLQKLHRLVASPNPSLVKQAFSFCKQYQSTPQGLLSYMEWSPERITAAIAQSKLPMAFIVGSRDDRLGPDWIRQLQTTPARVHVIEGANHFMDGQHEFDMLDKLQDELKD